MNTLQTSKNFRVSTFDFCRLFLKELLVAMQTPPNIYIRDYSPLSPHYIQCAKMLAKSRLDANLLRISAVLLVEIISLHGVKRVTVNFYIDIEEIPRVNSND